MCLVSFESQILSRGGGVFRVSRMNELVQAHRRGLVAGVLFAAAPLLAGCGGMDFSLKDAEWFNRPTMFSRSLSIETPPLSDGRPVSAADLISAEIL